MGELFFSGSVIFGICWLIGCLILVKKIRKVIDIKCDHSAKFIFARKLYTNVDYEDLNKEKAKTLEYYKRDNKKLSEYIMVLQDENDKLNKKLNAEIVD